MDAIAETKTELINIALGHTDEISMRCYVSPGKGSGRSRRHFHSRVLETWNQGCQENARLIAS